MIQAIKPVKRWQFNENRFAKDSPNQQINVIGINPEYHLYNSFNPDNRLKKHVLKHKNRFLKRLNQN